MASSDSGPGGAIWFVNVTNPATGKHTSVDRSAMHSHAARVTHARARHARAVQYQAANVVASQRPPRRHPNDGQVADTALVGPTSHSAADQPLGVWAENPTTAVTARHPVPGGLGSGRRDLFASFARPFTPIEHRLLDYCEYD
jgi:hypothetical protein